MKYIILIMMTFLVASSALAFNIVNTTTSLVCISGDKDGFSACLKPHHVSQNWDLKYDSMALTACWAEDLGTTSASGRCISPTARCRVGAHGVQMISGVEQRNEGPVFTGYVNAPTVSCN